MLELVKLIWDICCLRRGPQDLPYSPALLLVVCLLTLGFEVVVDMDASTLAYGAAALAINLGILYAILAARGLRNRFAQSATALIACALAFDLLILPFQLLFGDPKSTQLSPGRGLIALAVLMLMSWKLVVDANIFRHSFNVPFMTGMVIAVTWFLATVYVLHWLAPPATGT